MQLVANVLSTSMLSIVAPLSVVDITVLMMKLAMAMFHACSPLPFVTPSRAELHHTLAVLFALLPTTCVRVSVPPHLLAFSVLRPLNVPLASVFISVTIWPRPQNVEMFNLPELETPWVPVQFCTLPVWVVTLLPQPGHLAL